MANINVNSNWIIDGTLTATIAALGSPATTFLTHTAGLIQSRTVAQLLTDIGTIPVTSGGTGRATGTTAYGLIAAGTTATGVQQTLPAGLTTQILVGGGASALPVWTTATGSGSPVRATSPAFATSVTGGATFSAFNTTTTTLNLGGAATTLNVGGTPTTAVTHNYSANATANTITKTVNLGTSGASGSTTNINIGSATGGALGTTTINSVTLAAKALTTTGTATIGTIGVLGSTATTFLTHTAGLVQSRTAAQVLADIGAAPTLVYGTDNQIPIMNTGGTAFEYSSGFTFDSGTYLLDIGVNDTSLGTLHLRGGSGNIGGYLQIYNGALQDTTNNSWSIWSNASGNLQIDPTTTGAQLIFSSTALTLNSTPLVLNSINAATTDTDLFLVSDGGQVKSRTGAELLSDIGAQAAGNYLLDTTDTFTGTLTVLSTVDIGADGSSKGLLSLYGNATTTQPEIRLYHSNTYDTSNEYWRMYLGGTGFNIFAGSGAGGSLVLSTTSASLFNASGTGYLILGDTISYMSDPNDQIAFKITGDHSTNTGVLTFGDEDGSNNGYYCEVRQSNSTFYSYGNLESTGKTTTDTLNVIGSGAALPASFYSENFSVSLGDFTTGGAGWARVTDEGNGDLFSARTNAVGDWGAAYLYLTKTTTVNYTALKFDYKTSTEGNYDFLYLLIDGALIKKYSGTNAWTTDTVYINGIGSHKITWVYQKDPNTAGGTDQCWVDNVSLHNITDFDGLEVNGSTIIDDELYVQGSTLLEGDLGVVGDVGVAGKFINFSPNGGVRIRQSGFDSGAVSYWRNGNEVVGSIVGAGSTENYFILNNPTNGAQTFKASVNTTENYISLLSGEVHLGQAYSNSGFMLNVVGTGSFTGQVRTAGINLQDGDDGNLVVRYSGVAGKVIIGDSLGYYNGLEFDSGGNLITFANDGTELARIWGTGKMSIGNTNNTYKLDVSGDGRFYKSDTTLTPLLLIHQASTGDAIIGFTQNTNNWVCGIDATKSSFDIVKSTSINTTAYMSISSSGNISFASGNVSTNGTISGVDSTRKEISSQASTSYTITTTDAYKVRTCTSSSATTITVDTGSLTNIGDVAEIERWGTGSVTVAAGTATLRYNANDTLVLDGIYSRVAIQKMSSTEYKVFGQLTPA